MKRFGKVTAALSAAVAGLAAGVLLHRRRGDPQVDERVRAALSDQFGPPAGSIQVTAHRGTVTLRGEVGHLDDIDAYEAAARGVGVRDVNNLLRLAAVTDAPPLTQAR